jgi:hypothetical protein
MDTITLTICPDGIEETRQDLDDILEALVRINVRRYQRLPGAPCCPHCAGVKYRPPTPAEEIAPGEHFEDLCRMVVLGEAACGPIAAMQAAHMRIEGRTGVRARAISQSMTQRKYHVVVELEDGSFLDPTTELESAVSVGAVQPRTCGCGA